MGFLWGSPKPLTGLADPARVPKYRDFRFPGPLRAAQSRARGLRPRLGNPIRAAAERAVASVKTWRMLSEEGGRYRAPISKYGEMLAAVTGLFFSNYYNPL